MKCLVLVISDNSHPVYDHHRTIWSSYMHQYPEIDAYFITHLPDIDTAQTHYDTIYIPGKEELGTILHKTVESIKFCTTKTEYDFVLRTNLSSVWLFSRFLDHLRTLPTQNVYAGFCGNHNGIAFVSGAGCLMSIDVATQLCKSANLAYTFKQLDDVAIGATFQILRIPISGSFPRLTIHYTTEQIIVPANVWHVRVKLVDNRMNEPRTMRLILSDKIEQE